MRFVSTSLKVRLCCLISQYCRSVVYNVSKNIVEGENLPVLKAVGLQRQCHHNSMICTKVVCKYELCQMRSIFNFLNCYFCIVKNEYGLYTCSGFVCKSFSKARYDKPILVSRTELSWGTCPLVFYRMRMYNM